MSVYLVLVVGAMKRRIRSLHIPPCQRHMVIVTILSAHCVALLHRSDRSANQTSAKCWIEFTTRGGYRMFPGLSASALTLPLVPVGHESYTLGLVSTLPQQAGLRQCSVPAAEPPLRCTTHQGITHQPCPHKMGHPGFGLQGGGSGFEHATPLVLALGAPCDQQAAAGACFVRIRGFTS